MNHKYKRCAWHNKPKRVNETLEKLIAKKYSVEYVKPSIQNKLSYGVARKINIAAHNAFKALEPLVNKIKESAAEAFKNMNLKLGNKLSGRTT